MKNQYTYKGYTKMGLCTVWLESVLVLCVVAPASSSLSSSFLIPFFLVLRILISRALPPPPPFTLPPPSGERTCKTVCLRSQEPHERHNTSFYTLLLLCRNNPITGFCVLCIHEGLGLWCSTSSPAAFFLRSSLLSFLEVAVLLASTDGCLRSSSVIKNTGLLLTSWKRKRRPCVKNGTNF